MLILFNLASCAIEGEDVTDFLLPRPRDTMPLMLRVISYLYRRLKVWNGLNSVACIRIPQLVNNIQENHWETHVTRFSVCLNVFVCIRIHWDFGLRRPWWARCATWLHYYRWRWLWLWFAENGPSAPAASPRSNGQEEEKKKQLVPLCRLPFHKAAKRSTCDALPRYSTPERGRRRPPRRIWEAEGESYEWVELGVELISICVRNYFL